MVEDVFYIILLLPISEFSFFILKKDASRVFGKRIDRNI